MQASAGGGISGAAARAAGSESLSPCERSENLCMERVLRERDGLGFCRSSLADRRLNPTPENPFEYKQRERDREREHERDERESCEPCDDNVSVSSDASCASNLSFETVSPGMQDMGNGWVWDPSIQRFLKKETEKTHPLYGPSAKTGLNPMASSFTRGEEGGGVCSRRGKVGSGGQGMGAGSNLKNNRSVTYGANAEKGGQAGGRQW